MASISRAVAALRPAEVPIDLGREEARELARRELSKPVYDRDPPLVTRVLRWLLEQVDRLLDAAAGAMSSRLGIAVVIAIVVLLAAVVILRAGPMARRAAQRREPVLPARRRSAAEHRAAADAAAGESDWATAVVERYRAIVAGLEERGVLDVRSGRTADEAAHEAAAVLPGSAEGLRTGARLFDSVRYGRGEARRVDDETLRRLDDDVRAAQPRAPAGGGARLAVPR